MPLASHLRRRDVPIAVVNPLTAKYFANSRLARTKAHPADARSLAEMAMRDAPSARDPLAGAELRQAARFAMTLVTEQAKVCQRLIRLVALGFPELGEMFDDPTCRTAREILRIAPTATRRRTSTLADANGEPGHRGLGPAKAERLQAAAASSIAVPEPDAEVAFEVDLLLDQYDLARTQIEAADQRVASLLDGELARRLQTIPGLGPSIVATLLAEIGDIGRPHHDRQRQALEGWIHEGAPAGGRDARGRAILPPGQGLSGDAGPRGGPGPSFGGVTGPSTMRRRLERRVATAGLQQRTAYPLVHETGDHSTFVGHVDGRESLGGTPLMYYRSSYTPWPGESHAPGRNA